MKKSVVRTTERNAFFNARYNAAKFPADGNDPVAHNAASFIVLPIFSVSRKVFAF